MTAVVITAALFFCNITPLKNAAKDSLPCPDNTNKFILFWVKYIYIYIYTGDRRFSGNLWKSATSSPPELKKIETWQTTHFEDK